jgi:transcriptional regulator with XRE-family HTH domain
MYEHFIQLLQKNQVSPYRVSKDTGIGQSTFTDWKNGRSIPKKDKLQKLADYFGVPLSYFDSEEEVENNDNNAEQFEYFYLNNEKLYSPLFSKFIKLKRIDEDMTEKTLSATAGMTIDKYIGFEEGNVILTSEELCKIMTRLNVSIPYVSGTLSALQKVLKLIESECDDTTRDKLINTMLNRYDLYELERNFVKSNENKEGE